MTISCSIVSFPEKAGGKPNTRKREWTEATKLRVYCAQYNRHPSVSTNASSHVLRHRVRTWGGCLLECSVSASALTEGNREKRAQPRHSRKRDHAKKDKKQDTDRSPGATGAHAGRSKVFETCFSSAVLGSAPLSKTPAVSSPDTDPGVATLALPSACWRAPTPSISSVSLWEKWRPVRRGPQLYPSGSKCVEDHSSTDAAPSR